MPSLWDLCSQCSSGSVGEVKAAIARGEDVNAKEGCTCLVIAIYMGHVEVVELLLQSSEIDVNAMDGTGTTALHASVRPCIHSRPCNSIRIVRRLLAHNGLECNHRCMKELTPLMFAVSWGNVKAVKMLMEDERVDLDLRDKQGRTLEKIAREKLYGEVDPQKQIDTLYAISQGRMMRMKRKENFISQISSLENNRNLSDMTVVCKEEEFHCHRNILAARSPTFAGLTSGMIEATEGKWRMNEADPAAVKDMLHFIYTSDISEEGIKERAEELLDLARQYQLPELTAACRKALVKRLSPGNAVRTLIQLDQADLDQSATKEDKDQVIIFIKKNVGAVVKNEEWKTFVTTYPDLVTEIMMCLDRK